MLNHCAGRGVFLCALLVFITVAAAAAPPLRYEVTARHPHRSAAFTQGLELIDGVLYESSGLYQKSFIARWRLDDNAPVEKQPLEPGHFGEGLTVLDGRIYVLTWQSQRGLIFDQKTLEPRGEFAYAGEGWGLTHDGRRLIMSNGSAALQFIDPQTLKVVKTLAVTERGRPLQRLNELEWVQGRILANIWQSDEIAVIDPDSGAVTTRLDLGKLYPRGLRAPGADVLNGIALDRRDNTLLVTGKRWPTLYRLRLLQPLP